MTKIYEKSPAFFDTFDRKPSMKQTTHYCPGCGHGILNKIIADQVAELGLQDRAIFVGPVGCGVFIYYYFESAAVSSAHGRASAVATGVSRANQDAVTISYQGDGDLAAIGTSNAIHAANRGENMVVFFVNNNIYGMTGGQLAPTTLIDQTSATSPYGRSIRNDGFPLRMAEMIAGLEAWLPGSPSTIRATFARRPKWSSAALRFSATRKAIPLSRYCLSARQTGKKIPKRPATGLTKWSANNTRSVFSKT